MIDSRGGKDSEPNRRKARRLLQAQAAERTIDLDRLQETESKRGERGQVLKRFCWPAGIQSRAQIPAEIRRDRQPAHHRTARGGALHRNDRIVGRWIQTDKPRGELHLTPQDTTESWSS